MKNIVLIAAVLSLLSACKKDLETVNITDSDFVKTGELQVVNDDELILNGEIISGHASEYGFVYNKNGTGPFVNLDQKIRVITPGGAKTYTSRLDATYPGVTYAIRAYGKIDGQVYYGKTVRYTTLPRGSWKRMKNFPGPQRKFPVSFAVNGKGYVCCGRGTNGNLNDVWEFDPATDTWTQIGDYPGSPMNSGFSFVIGNKAYVGGGSYDTPPYSNYGGYRSFYEFDPATKSWTKLSDLPLGDNAYALYGAVGFSIDGAGYVAGGATGGSAKFIGILKFDAAAKTWEHVAILPTNYRNEVYYCYYGSAFVLGDLVYLDLGFTEWNFSTQPNLCYTWNYKTKVWQPINDVPGPQTACRVATTNSGAGYMGMGLRSGELYQFKPSATTTGWKEVTYNPNYYSNQGSVCFTIGNKTYFGLGEPVSSNRESNHLYEFTHTR
ncbi:Kelch repeat-containing protein [Longitalea luteola]|uniref:Kelch repeat-containing protein n=1 Tax=Longitalea luteola TaxID=2812563 RepID=UPI001A96FD47|nr:kelch repeat-containing protein [Longitalea luteola]